ncbi:MAG: mechanosensitive ion channel [Eubacteriales bacterium]|nr:mechanosensitive ion channel [Eubacteriales bacterium]
MDQWMNSLTELLTNAGGKLLLALLVWIIGSFVVKSLLKGLGKSRLLAKIDDTVRSFALSAAKVVLYVILIVAIISILGVPMASVITVLASCGVAVGMALQGALSNLAGGIMLMIFRPFRTGDFIEAAGVSGAVQDLTLFYTVILSVDNKRITIPNGTLMNANITNFSSEELRRVDLTCSCAKSEKPAEIQKLLMDAVSKTDKILKAPEAFARLSGGSDEAMEFTVRVWTRSEDYWDVYFDLNQNIVETLSGAGVKQPAARITVETQN